MYNSDKYRIEFKLAPKDLLMMDNLSDCFMEEHLMKLKKVIDFYKVVILIMIALRESLDILKENIIFRFI